MLFNTRILASTRQKDIVDEIIRNSRDQERIISSYLNSESHIVCFNDLDGDIEAYLRYEADQLNLLVFFQQSSSNDNCIEKNGFVIGSASQLFELQKRLSNSCPPKLKELGIELGEVLLSFSTPINTTLKLGRHEFNIGQRTYIMAIMNITPDSFSGDGLMKLDDVLRAAVIQANNASVEGADILDIGGVATFPGAPPVDPEEEYRRVVPVIKELSKEVDIPISIDSYNTKVIEGSINAGASLINSYWGLQTPEGAWNESLAKLVASTKIPLVLAHNRSAQGRLGPFGNYYPSVEYNDLLSEVISELRESVQYAEKNGISKNQLIVDPGLGQGKTPEQNLMIIRRLKEVRNIGLPVLISASRKSFIGYILNVPPHERDNGTASTTAIAIQNGVDIIRVHNVHLNVQVAKMTDALIR